MFEQILRDLKIGQTVPAEQYSPLTLAYIGDCVFELYVRTFLIRNANAQVEKLHRRAVGYSNCKAQAEFVHKIMDVLTEEELAVYKRGRNAKSIPPKNAEISDYKAATGLEAVLGYLYIKGETDRLAELLGYIR